MEFEITVTPINADGTRGSSQELRYRGSRHGIFMALAPMAGDRTPSVIDVETGRAVYDETFAFDF
jgi:hypothetical protein